MAASLFIINRLWQATSRPSRWSWWPGCRRHRIPLGTRGPPSQVFAAMRPVWISCRHCHLRVPHTSGLVRAGRVVQIDFHGPFSRCPHPFTHSVNSSVPRRSQAGEAWRNPAQMLWKSSSECRADLHRRHHPMHHVEPLHGSHSQRWWGRRRPGVRSSALSTPCSGHGSRPGSVMVLLAIILIGSAPAEKSTVANEHRVEFRKRLTFSSAPRQSGARPH